MRKALRYTFFTSFFACISLFAKAQTYSLYDELAAVNPEWKQQADANNSLRLKTAKPLSEQQLVQFHLAETEKLLRSRDVSNLSRKQKENRLKNLDVLHQYMLAGVYPVNSGHANRQPYFIDDNDTYCAVGYLMKESGADSIARYIHQTQNFSYLKDIVHKDLMTWAEQSGLTIDELALIQPAYGGGNPMPATITELHYNNIGKDTNEYIEVVQASLGAGPWKPFNIILFYDSTGVVYKTIPLTNVYFSLVYSLFPPGDTFANSGKVELRYRDSQSDLLLSAATYNGDSVRVTDTPSGTTDTLRDHVYYVGENETTPEGTSLSFCGHYQDTWNLSHQPASVGMVNSCIVMPVTFGQFTYAINQNKVNLTWQTLNETNSQSFRIERSADGMKFTEIGTVKASVNHSSVKQYSYTDDAPQYINFYRIRQVDADGTNSYSKVLNVKVDAASKLVLRQTLVNNDLAYQNTSTTSGSRIEVYNIEGKKMYSGLAGSGVQHINTSSFAAGKYIIRLTVASGEVYTRQFLKSAL